MTDGQLSGGLYMTYHPSIVEWMNGNVKERIVIPAGGITDYSSIPDSGLLGWVAKKLGFDKNAEYFTRAGKIHDPLYFALKYWNGFLPDGWFQFYNPLSERWEPIVAYRWTRKVADKIWCRVAIEDGCPEKIAKRGYKFLRIFGGIHMKLH